MVHEYTKKDSSELLSANFQVGEFLCRCGCGRALVDDTLVGFLQRIRDHFNQPVIITSPYRCDKHNKSSGGAVGSRHTKGQAADFYIPHVEPAEIAKYAESIGVKGIGLYEKADCGDSFVHIDTRTSKSFWYGHDQDYRSTFGGTKKEECVVKLDVLKMGAEGSTVKALQTLLIGYGYSCGRSGADGSFGSATDKAVRAYQKNKGLTADGSVGPKTWAALLGV